MAQGDLRASGTFTGNANSITNPLDATGSVSVTIGDLIVGVIGEQTGLTSSGVTDNLGNTYSAVNAGTNAATTISGRCWYSRATVGGTLTAIHFAATASSNNASVVGAVFEGPFSVSPLDAAPANNNNTDNTTAFTCPASGTLANANELVIGWMVGTSGATWTASAPNTKAIQALSQSVAATILGYQTVASTSTVSPAFAGTNPSASVQGTASFKFTIQASPTGVAGTGAAGTITVVGKASTGAIPGSAGTGAAGTPTVTTSSAGDLTVASDTTVVPYQRTILYESTFDTVSFAVPVSASVTGVAGTGAAGTLSVAEAALPASVSNTVVPYYRTILYESTFDTVPFAVAVSATVTGVNATGAAGTPTVVGKANVDVIGVAGTGSPGTPTVTGFASTNITGVAGTGASGTPTVVGKANVNVTGASGTGSPGTLSVAEAPLPASVSNTVVPYYRTILYQSLFNAVSFSSSVSASLTGVAATGAVGTASVAEVPLPTSVSNTIVPYYRTILYQSLFNPVITPDVPVAFSEYDISVPYYRTTISPSLQEPTPIVLPVLPFATSYSVVQYQRTILYPSTQGAPAAFNVSATLTGVSATGNVGAIAVSAGGSVSVAVDGVAATGAVGTPTVVGKAVVDVIGVAASGEVGTLTVTVPVSVSVTLSGLAATGSVGTLTAAGNAIVVETPDVGSGISGGTFSRGRWRAMEDARKSAQERADNAKKKKERDAIEAATAAAKEAIAAARSEAAAHAEVEEELRSMERHLASIAGAKTIADVIKQSAATIKMAEAIMREIEEQEELDFVISLAL